MHSIYICMNTTRESSPPSIAGCFGTDGDSKEIRKPIIFRKRVAIATLISNMWGVSKVIQGRECILPNNYGEKNGDDAPRTVVGDLMFCAYLSLTCHPQTNARGWYDYHQNYASRLSWEWSPPSLISEQIQRGYHSNLPSVARSVSATAAKYWLGNTGAIFS